MVGDAGFVWGRTVFGGQVAVDDCAREESGKGKTVADLFEERAC
jgi:hypothetical protein